MERSASRPAFWPEIRVLLLVAMAIFVYTIGIGILNGTDAHDFDQRRILGHVHGGTLGWLTLGVFAASLWLFGGERAVSDRERLLVRAFIAAAIVAIPCYVAAFSLTYSEWRPVLGSITTLVIAAFFGWVAWRAQSVTLGVPHWGFLVALATSVIGGFLGVLLGMELATGDNWLPGDGPGAHAGTMVVGFLVPIAMAMVEWAFFFPNPPLATRLGRIQMLFPFAGGVLLMLSLLLDIVPLAPIAILLEIAGLGILVYRLRPRLLGVDWRIASPERHAVFGLVAVIFTIGLAQYFIIRYDGDFDLVPPHQLLALDHAQFIGAMTNAIFAMLMAATAGRRGSRVDQVIFAAVNVGIAGFVIGLLGDWTPMKRIFTPIMGAGLLVALAVYAWRLLPEVSGAREREELRASGAPGGGG
jgi:hypothetical protein